MNTRNLAAAIALALAISSCGSDAPTSGTDFKASADSTTEAAEHSTEDPTKDGPTVEPTVDPAPEPTATPEPTAAPEPTALEEPSVRELPTVEAPLEEIPDGFPAGDEASMAAFVNPLVEDLGLRFTYGSLIDRTRTGSFQPAPDGDHYAVYVEPISDDYTDTEFIENTWILAQRFTPLMFETYPGLASFDICQEPRPGDNDQDRPPPTTQLDIFREEAEAFDWENGGLAGLIVLSRENSSTTLRLESRLQQLPAFIDALAEADG